MKKKKVPVSLSSSGADKVQCHVSDVTVVSRLVVASFPVRLVPLSTRPWLSLGRGL
jgi:hypothetical protein